MADLDKAVLVSVGSSKSYEGDAARSLEVVTDLYYK
jgi:hypothetical protein